MEPLDQLCNTMITPEVNVSVCMSNGTLNTAAHRTHRVYSTTVYLCTEIKAKEEL